MSKKLCDSATTTFMYNYISYIARSGSGINLFARIIPKRFDKNVRVYKAFCNGVFFIDDEDHAFYEFCVCFAYCC